MATTSNFGWSTPDDTDLVKDGALAIRTLGNNIDTSLVDLKGGTTGQILSKNSNTDLDYTWINNDQGDITAVTAGTGISGGGTTGAVTITNDMATTITASGDIIVGTGSGTYDNLPIGTTGQVLTADTTVSPYKVKWAAAAAGADFVAGKNKIINGDFFINARAFSSTTTDQTYGFDRWQLFGTGNKTTYSAQTFTPGTAPVTGYEAANFARLVTATQNSAGDYGFLSQKIEDVRTFANQTITYSFWAKAGSGTPLLAIGFSQNFGSGGSPSAAVYTYAGQVTLSTSWARYSVTVAIPSISGKTIGTTANSSFLRADIWASAGSDYNANTGSLGLQNGTFDIWGVQAEAGSTATPFTTATGSLGGELALCQRYYFRITAGAVYGRFTPAFPATSATQVYPNLHHPVTMRIAPTTLEYSTVALYDGTNIITNPTLTITSANTNITAITVDSTGLTQYRPYQLMGNNSATAYVALSAEL